MANYRLEIQVRITPCDDEQTVAPVRQGDGLFTYVLSAEQALSIDRCEQAVLATNFVVVRTALAEHFSAVSQARATAVAQASAEVRAKPYRVDGEVGPVHLPGAPGSYAQARWCTTRPPTCFRLWVLGSGTAPKVSRSSPRCTGS